MKARREGECGLWARGSERGTVVSGPDSKACFYSFCVVFPRKRLYDVCVQAHVGGAID